MAKKLIPFKPRSHVIRGDAFCHAIADISDRMLSEFFEINTSTKSFAWRTAAIIKMIRDLGISARTDSMTSRVYIKVVKKARMVTTYQWFACSSWVDQLDLPQKPDRRRLRIARSRL